MKDNLTKMIRELEQRGHTRDSEIDYNKIEYIWIGREKKMPWANTNKFKYLEANQRKFEQ